MNFFLDKYYLSTFSHFIGQTTAEQRYDRTFYIFKLKVERVYNGGCFYCLYNKKSME